MVYFVFPFLLLIYFELFGRWLIYKFKISNLHFPFLIGFLAIMAFIYVISWPISAFNGNFYHLAFLYGFLFVLSLVFIIKDIKRISFKFDIKLWIIFFIFLIFEIYISYHRTLGDPHGFDPLYYINMISFNIGNTELNSLHPHFGTYPNNDIQWITYVFQSYYYFIGVVIYFVSNVLAVVNISFEMMPTFVWSFEIFQEMFFIGTSLVCINELKTENKILKISYLILLILFMGNFYYNNVYGFIGNNFRMSIHALASIYLFRYFNHKDIKDLYCCFVIMLSMCALSSTGTFALIFFLFALFFVLCGKEKNLLRSYLIICYVPIVNILVVKLGQKIIIPIGVLILFGIIGFLSNYIENIFKEKKVKVITIAICFLVMVGLSFSVTHNLFDFNTFFNNYSEIADMSWDYFMFNDLRHYIFNLLVLIPLFYYLFKDRKDNFALISWILIIVFYNPFVCTYLNKINWVYYRTYDIIINNFTIIYFLDYFINELKYKKIISFTVLGLTVVLAVNQIPRFYHESFIPDDDYNPIYKIENSELELIRNVRSLISDNDMKNPKIINQTFYMASYIKNSTYLIGKEKRYDYSCYDDVTYNLYLIFFPHDYAYDNFWPTGAEADYDNLKYYLDNCDYDVLIVNSNSFFYDDEGNYIQLSSYVEECGYKKSDYSTYLYDIYLLN